MKGPPLRPPASVRLLRLVVTCLNATGLALPWLIRRGAFVGLVRRFFGRIASRYDHLGAQLVAVSERAHPLDAAVGGPALAAAQPAGLSPRLIADLATGTGAAAFRLAERFPESRVVATDLSFLMLRELRRKGSANSGEPPSPAEAPTERGPRSTRVPAGTPVARGRVLPLAADSRRLPFREGAFDLVVSMNAPPYLAEMKRIAKPGGFVVMAYYLCTFTQQVARLARWRLRREGLEEAWAQGVGLGFALRGRRGA